MYLQNGYARMAVDSNMMPISDWLQQSEGTEPLPYATYYLVIDRLSVDDAKDAVSRLVNPDCFLRQGDVGLDSAQPTQLFLGIDGLEVRFDETLLEVVEVLHNLDHIIVASLPAGNSILVAGDAQFAHHAAHVAFSARHAARLGQSLGHFPRCR